MALLAVYLAVFRDWQQHLQPGESATILLLAADRRKARVVFRYIRALLTKCPLLADMVQKERSSDFVLTNNVHIEIGTHDLNCRPKSRLHQLIVDKLECCG
jgi:hypothetical protein